MHGEFSKNDFCRSWTKNVFQEVIFKVFKNGKRSGFVGTIHFWAMSAAVNEDNNDKTKVPNDVFSFVVFFLFFTA